MIPISEHISWEEAVGSATASRLGIANRPNPEQLEAMKALAENVFEPLRTHIGKPIIVTSFFRSPALNKAINGSKSSQHMKGEAIDIKGSTGVKNSDIFNHIKQELEFDQLIWEFGTNKEPAWIHVSYSTTHNRRQVLRASKKQGKTLYTAF